MSWARVTRGGHSPLTSLRRPVSTGSPGSPAAGVPDSCGFWGVWGCWDA